MDEAFACTQRAGPSTSSRSTRDITNLDMAVGFLGASGRSGLPAYPTHLWGSAGIRGSVLHLGVALRMGVTMPAIAGLRPGGEPGKQQTEFRKPWANKALLRWEKGWGGAISAANRPGPAHQSRVPLLPGIAGCD